MTSAGGLRIVLVPTKSRAPLLTKVYRWGPGRQRLSKGYVLAGANVQQLRDTVVGATQALARQQGVTLRVDERASHAVWLDTGLIWLHTTSERERWASQLGRLVAELGRHAEAAGGRLLPNAVRVEASEPWANLTCGDEHYIETSSELEKSAYCNLLRLHLPQLIALTGRAGAGPAGVEDLCSRRLADSDRHLAAREFVSLAPSYLAHVVKSLVRDEGVRRLDLLDIDPRVHNPLAPGADCDRTLGLRFVDGQISVRTAIAHGMLFQALLIRAKRLVAASRSVQSPRQRELERSRSSCIVHGLDARLEPAQQAQKRSSHAADAGSKGKHDRGPSAGNGKAPDRELARHALRRLFNSLVYEFQALEVAPHELSPLLLGMSLRDWGLSGLQNENDLLRVMATLPAETLHQRLRRLMERGEAPDPLSEYNKQHFPQQMRSFDAEWRDRLRPKQQPAVAPNKSESSDPAAAAPKPRPTPPNASGPTAAPASTNASKRAKLRSAVTRLQQFLVSDGSEQAMPAALAAFAAESGAKDVARALKLLSEVEGRRLLDRLVGAAPVHELRAADPSPWTWETPELSGVLQQARQRLVLRLATSSENQSSLDSAVQKLLNTHSVNWNVVVLERRQNDAASAVERDLLLVRSSATGEARRAPVASAPEALQPRRQS